MTALDFSWLDELRTAHPEVPRVVHCKRDPYDVLIGRPSKWGNPYKLGEDGTREQVVRWYDPYVRFTRPDLLAALPDLHGKTLGCWCAPQLCHGHVLAALVAEALGAAARCESCNALFPRARTGRPRKFCTGRCRQLHHRYANVLAPDREEFRDTAVTKGAGA
jgi:hypothetical protein